MIEHVLVKHTHEIICHGRGQLHARSDGLLITFAAAIP